MNIPRYWAKVDLTARNFRGKLVPFSCWRWSDNSLASARALATEAAKRIKLRIEGAGGVLERYGYGSRPLREQIIEEFRARDGLPSAAVTRNAFGCLVLNTARVMFVDVDLPRAGALRRALHGIELLFKGVPHVEGRGEAAAIARVEAFVRENPHWGFRIYRTRAGLRLLVTHTLIDPDLPTAENVMRALGCDPLYLKLCHAQQSFRARLTPKPWRIGMRRPRSRYPWDNEEAESDFKRWLSRYEAGCETYSTCALLKIIGAERIHPDIGPLLRIHDEYTRVAHSRPLA